MVAPLNNIALIIFAAVGLCGLPLVYSDYRSRLAHCDRAGKIIFAGVAAVLVIYAARHLSYYYGYLMMDGDTGLYHAQIVRWYKEYGAVCGLGNLHARLAFNSSYFSLGALFDHWWWNQRSAFLMPALLLVGATLYFLRELLFARETGARFYAAVLMSYLVYVAMHNHPGFSYNVPPHLINAVVVLEAYYLLNRRDRVAGKSTDMALLLLLAVGAFTIKPIGAVSVFFAGGLILFLLWRERANRRLWAIAVLPAAVALGVWVARNLITSGYPFYPLPLLAMPFDWTMTDGEANGNYLAITAWSRMPGEGSLTSLENGFWFWFKPWLVRSFQSGEFLFLGVLPFIFAVIGWARVARSRRSWQALFFFVWANANILYWWVGAPHISYGSGFFWVNLGLALLFLNPIELWRRAALRFEKSRLGRRKKLLFAGGLILILAVNLIGTAASKRRSLIFMGKVTVYPVVEHTVNSMPPFKVWVPVAGDQTGDSPLPSSPYPSVVDNIEMRVPGDWGRGFRPVSSK